MAKPTKTLKLYYPVIQFLILSVNHLVRQWHACKASSACTAKCMTTINMIYIFLTKFCIWLSQGFFEVLSPTYRFSFFVFLFLDFWIFSWLVLFPNSSGYSSLYPLCPHLSINCKIQWIKCVLSLQCMRASEHKGAQTICRYITNSQHDRLPVGLIAQLAEHCTSIQGILVWIPFRPKFFFRQILQLL